VTSLQGLSPALAALALVITLLEKESLCIDRIPGGAAVGEEVLPKFKNPKVAFHVCNHLFVWLAPLFDSHHSESMLHSSVSQAVVWMRFSRANGME